jgi:hypothetical protein
MTCKNKSSKLSHDGKSVQWNELIADTEERIAETKKRLSELELALRTFKENEKDGRPWPLEPQAATQN